MPLMLSAGGNGEDGGDGECTDGKPAARAAAGMDCHGKNSLRDLMGRDQCHHIKRAADLWPARELKTLRRSALRAARKPSALRGSGRPVTGSARVRRRSTRRTPDTRRAARPEYARWQCRLLQPIASRRPRHGSHDAPTPTRTKRGSRPGRRSPARRRARYGEAGSCPRAMAQIRRPRNATHDRTPVQRKRTRRPCAPGPMDHAGEDDCRVKTR